MGRYPLYILCVWVLAWGKNAEIVDLIWISLKHGCRLTETLNLSWREDLVQETSCYKFFAIIQIFVIRTKTKPNIKINLLKPGSTIRMWIMKSTSWGGVGGQAELHSQECSLTFRRSFLALFACVSTLCGALSSQSCVCERRLMFVSSVWSPLLCQINVCNEANPLSTNNLIHQALIFLPPPPPFFFLAFFCSETWNAPPGHLKLARNKLETSPGLQKHSE